MNSDFTNDEIVQFERYDKKLKKNVIKKFPVVGGRLRLYHNDIEECEFKEFGIQSEIVQYENDIAVIRSTVNLNGSMFTGIGMASKARDAMIFPAILEMAETRSIARALRFAGYGVEYTGAEEMTSVKNFEPDNKASGEPSTSKKKTEKKEEAPAEDDKPGDDEKLTHMDDMISPKRLVWEYVKNEYAEVDEKYLADKIKSFVAAAVEKGGESSSEENVFKAILENKDRFLHAFNGNMETPKKKSLKRSQKTSPTPP